MTKCKKCNAQSVTDRQEAIKSICPDGARSVQQLLSAENMMEIEAELKLRDPHAETVTAIGADMTEQIEKAGKA